MDKIFYSDVEFLGKILLQEDDIENCFIKNIGDMIPGDEIDIDSITKPGTYVIVPNKCNNKPNDTTYLQDVLCRLIVVPICTDLSSICQYITSIGNDGTLKLFFRTGTKDASNIYQYTKWNKIITKSDIIYLFKKHMDDLYPIYKKLVNKRTDVAKCNRSIEATKKFSEYSGFNVKYEEYIDHVIITLTPQYQGTDTGLRTLWTGGSSEFSFDLSPIITNMRSPSKMVYFSIYGKTSNFDTAGLITVSYERKLWSNLPNFSINSDEKIVIRYPIEVKAT